MKALQKAWSKRYTLWTKGNPNFSTAKGARYVVITAEIRRLLHHWGGYRRAGFPAARIHLSGKGKGPPGDSHRPRGGAGADGGQRPEGLRDRKTQQRSRQIHNARQLEVLSKRKDAQTAAVQKLRAALDRAAGLGQPGLEAELSLLREQVRLVEETLGLAEPQS